MRLDWIILDREWGHVAGDEQVEICRVSVMSGILGRGWGLDKDCATLRGCVLRSMLDLAALSIPFSHSQVDDQVNGFKMIKRAMYGRAKFDLLHQRILTA